LHYYKKSIFNKIIYRLGYRKIINDIQIIIFQKVSEFNPDISIVFKGMEIMPQTIVLLKAKGIKIVNYNPDNPFIFSGRGSGNRNVRNSITLYDFYFTYDDETRLRLLSKGVNSALIPFGYNIGGFDYNVLKECDEIKKICFLGNADKSRVSFLNNLAMNGYDVVVYGGNWSNFNIHTNIEIYGLKYGVDFYDILQKYIVQINLLRPHNLNSHNMRSFDIPGSGGIMLAPRTSDHVSFFEEGKEVFLFSNLNEAMSRLNSIFELSFVERNKIRAAARKKVISDYTYSKRVEKMIEYLSI
jgi:spore maturation protein CgeB